MCMACPQVADTDNAHAAVRTLHSVGGTLLALMRLEACIATHSVSQFMAAAPLLGITPDEPGALTQVSRPLTCINNTKQIGVPCAWGKQMM